MTANDSQKPPYDERAVAPKVLPTAISLYSTHISSASPPHIPSLRWRENLPHARKQLNQPPIPKRQPNHNIRCRQTTSPHIDQRQHERRQRESTQSQRSRIGKLALRDALVGTRLELSAKGRQATRLAGVDVREGAVAKARGGFGGFVLFVRHLAIDGVGVVGGQVGSIGAAVVFLVGAVDVLVGAVGSSHYRKRVEGSRGKSNRFVRVGGGAQVTLTGDDWVDAGCLRVLASFSEGELREWHDVGRFGDSFKGENESHRPRGYTQGG